MAPTQGPPLSADAGPSATTAAASQVFRAVLLASRDDRRDAGGPRSSAATSSRRHALRDDVAGAKAHHASEEHFRARVESRRLQLSNPDRARPKAEVGTVAFAKLRRRERRLVARLAKAASKSASKNKEGGKGSDGGHRRRGGAVSASKGARRKGAKNVTLGRTQRKRLGLEGVDDNVSYESLLPVHSLWATYVRQMLGLVDAAGRPASSMVVKETVPAEPGESVGRERLRWSIPPNYLASMHVSLLKADMMGAPVRVIAAASPSLVGIAGLVAKETEHTFVIVPEPPPTAAAADAPSLPSSRARTEVGDGRRSRARAFKVVPKRNLTLRLSVPLPAALAPSAASSSGERDAAPGPSAPAGDADAPPATTTAAAAAALEFELYGNQLSYSLPARATRKFKQKVTIDY